ncbi:MAG: hypothetical protein AAGK17_01715 [Pseudomonadota bacterium]
MARLLDSKKMHSDGKNSPLEFVLQNYDGMPRWNRVLSINGEETFHLGNVCETCAFFFERLSEANNRFEIGELRQTLENGMTEITASVSETVIQLMPKSDYNVVLLKVKPEQAVAGETSDYFANEDREFEEYIVNEGDIELQDPKTDYYRVGGRREIAMPSSFGTAKGFEFLVPITSKKELDSDRIDHFIEVLSNETLPTAIAVSLLDIKGPSVNDRTHWCLAHYIIDGHHKLAAAEQSGKEITLLAFVSL